MNPEASDIPHCPHCFKRLAKMSVPPDGGYDSEFLYVCFNDDCPYYIQGWDWMFRQYYVRASYRYRLNPLTGGEGPIAVWSPAAMKDRILLD